MKSKFFLILCFTIFATFAFAQAPQTLTYQGKLTDASGNAIEGSVALKFKLYDASSGGNLLWEESQQVEAIDGLVNVILGSVTPLALSFGQPLWLSISVDAGSELEPRTELTSAVSSFYASTIADSSVTDSKIGNDTVVRSLNGLRDDVMLMAGNNVTIDKQGDNLVISATGTGGADGLDCWDLNGNGTGDPNEDINGDGKFDAEDCQGPKGDDGDKGEKGDDGPKGDQGDPGPPGTTAWVEANGNLTTNGKVGIGTTNLTPGQLNVGAQGFAITAGSTAAIAVIGVSGGIAGVAGTATSGAGVQGISKSGDGIYGKQEDSDNKGWLGTSSAGVVGDGKNSSVGVKATSLSGAAVSAVSTSGDGVYGNQTNSNNEGWLGTSSAGVAGDGKNNSAGVKATSNNGPAVSAVSTSGDGVYGNQTNSKNEGRLGTGSAGVVGDGKNSSAGVIATSSSGSAVFANSTNGNGITAFGGAFAGNFVGKVNVTGTLTKGGGAFKIDHPLDPTNKYLYHSFVESPDMMNIYNGNVILDGSGEAWVELPEWFEALNKDFRYQLTCVGGFAQVYIATEITDRRFRIAGGSPGMKVSWQVTGIRHDAFAEANRIPVEELKPVEEIGKYLHPQALGYAEASGMFYAEKYKMETELQARRKNAETRVKVQEQMDKLQ